MRGYVWKAERDLWKNEWVFIDLFISLFFAKSDDLGAL